MDKITNLLFTHMKFKRIHNGYIIKIEKGEEIVETITKFCEDNNIKSGCINGIGGTDNVTINYYDLEKKSYITKIFKGKNYEIISLNGNVAVMEEKVILHIHIALGDSDYNVFGGHLKSAIIAITGEIIINLTDDVVHRKFDNEFKLNLLNL